MNGKMEVEQKRPYPARAQTKRRRPAGPGTPNERIITMGEIRTSVTLENRDDRGAVRLGLRAEADVRRTTAEGVVDTGAVTLVIPEEIATELGLEFGGHDRTDDAEQLVTSGRDFFAGSAGRNALVRVFASSSAAAAAGRSTR
ncbi:MAG: hypothetical protein OXG35_02535 [Acidobacteria bacterium]|nr:hypothetical protein [Acidobacteriota bacterium]